MRLRSLCLMPAFTSPVFCTMVTRRPVPALTFVLIHFNSFWSKHTSYLTRNKFSLEKPHKRFLMSNMLTKMEPLEIYVGEEGHVVLHQGCGRCNRCYFASREVEYSTIFVHGIGAGRSG